MVWCFLLGRMSRPWCFLVRWRVSNLLVGLLGLRLKANGMISMLLWRGGAVEVVWCLELDWFGSWIYPPIAICNGLEEGVNWVTWDSSRTVQRLLGAIWRLSADHAYNTSTVQGCGQNQHSLHHPSVTSPCRFRRQSWDYLHTPQGQPM